MTAIDGGATAEHVQLAGYHSLLAQASAPPLPAKAKARPSPLER